MIYYSRPLACDSLETNIQKSKDCKTRGPLVYFNFATKNGVAFSVFLSQYQSSFCDEFIFNGFALGRQEELFG